MAFSPVGASRSIGDLSRRKVPTDWLGWYARTRPIDTFQYLMQPPNQPCARLTGSLEVGQSPYRALCHRRYIADLLCACII